MVILTVIFFLYFLFLFALLVGWKRSPELPSPGGKEPLISVVVPARNEENTILKLLESLSAQDYKNFEIIVVDDDSEDETLWIVNNCQVKNIQVVRSPGKGKKAAITAGVRAARGSIVATTDADCLVPPLWLKQIREPFRDKRVMMVSGGVRIEANGSFFAGLQAMEFASLIGSGAATASLGFPTMCNGANLAFRKKTFSQVKGYEDNISVPSGDDEFLMRKIHRKYPGSIRFIYSPEAVVTTDRQPDLPSFLDQRLRWASKWRYNSSLHTRALGVLVVFFQVAFVVNWFYLFSPAILPSFFLIIVKMILEAAFLLQVCRFLDVRWKWPTFFSLQALYPPYVIGVAISSFFRSFEWKHRIFRPR